MEINSNLKESLVKSIVAACEKMNENILQEEITHLNKNPDVSIASFVYCVDASKAPLITTPGNRGSDNENGTKPSNSNHITNLIKNDEYHDDLPIIANMKGYVVDGNNRRNALTKAKKPLQYIRTRAKKLNQSDLSRVTNEMIKINSAKTAWGIKEIFECALDESLPVAHHIQKLIDKHKLDYKIVLRSLGLVEKKPAFFDGYKTAAKAGFEKSMFEDERILRILKSKKFIANTLNPFLNILIKITKSGKELNSSLRMEKALKPIYDAVFNKKASIEIFAKILGKKEHIDYIAGNKPAVVKDYLLNHYNAAVPLKQKI